MDSELTAKLERLQNASNDIFLGKEDVIKMAIVSIISNGHLLIEDVPGVGKTTLVYLLGRLFGLNISRIQFTNDLLPSDIVGVNIFDKDKHRFVFKKGPIFGHLVLGDELNRANPKTQSALLQSMEERHVTSDGNEYSLELPFIVIATQNPFQFIGTFPLPESQLDRFFMGINIGIPSRAYEGEIIRKGDTRLRISEASPIFTLEEVTKLHNEVESVHVSDEVLQYTLDILEHGRIELEQGHNISIRAGRDLIKAAKGHAYIESRDFVIPEDVKKVSTHVLGHRIGGSGGLKKGQSIIKEFVDEIKVI